MTNDQKLLLLISKCDELLNALDKQDTTNDASLFKAAAKKQRTDLKIWLAMNKLVTTEKTPPNRIRTVKSSTNNFRNNWLGQ